MDQETLWMQRVASGDRTAFEELFDAYKGRLLGYVYRMTGDAATAEDISIDVLVEVWKSAPRFQGRSLVSTWIFGIAHHKVIDEFRRREGRGEHVEVSTEIAAEGPNPEQHAVESDSRAALRRALQGLTPEHREVLELTFFQGRSIEEISAILRCPANTVKTRMFYARKKLREILESIPGLRNAL